MMKSHHIVFPLIFMSSVAFAADRDSSNLQVLKDSDYRQPLIEVIVRAQSTAPDWSVDEAGVATAAVPNASRLQWFPRYDPEKPVQPTSVNPNDEQPLIKIFQKIF